MKTLWTTCPLLLSAAIMLPAPAFAAWNGPAGAPCGGTTTSGQPYSGVQSWTTHNGRGYWTCATAGTKGFNNPQSEFRTAPGPDPDIETHGSQGERLTIKRRQSRS